MTIQLWVLLLENLCLIERVILGVIYYILAKWKYVDITTTNIQQCIKCVYDTGQENA